MEQYQRAIEDYGNAIRLSPELAVAYTNRALVYIRLNKNLETERDMDRAIALDYDPTVLRRDIEEIKKQC
jgi:tetratricopeptide (TPR) repeat protein